MKKPPFYLNAFTFTAILFLACGIAFVDNVESVKGIWLGNLEIGSGKELQIAIDISEKEDNWSR